MLSCPRLWVPLSYDLTMHSKEVLLPVKVSFREDLTCSSLDCIPTEWERTGSGTGVHLSGMASCPSATRVWDDHTVSTLSPISYTLPSCSSNGITQLSGLLVETSSVLTFYKLCIHFRLAYKMQGVNLAVFACFSLHIPIYTYTRTAQEQWHFPLWFAWGKKSG